MSFKFNGGAGAVLCDICSIIYKTPATHKDSRENRDFCPEHKEAAKLPYLDDLLEAYEVGDMRKPTNRWPTNSYVHFEGFKFLYVRVTPRIIDGVRYELVVDLANFEVMRQGLGTFSHLTVHLKESFGQFGIYVENVLNEGLRPWLLREGFKCVHESDMTPCYFRKPTK